MAFVADDGSALEKMSKPDAQAAWAIPVPAKTTKKPGQRT